MKPVYVINIVVVKAGPIFIIYSRFMFDISFVTFLFSHTHSIRNDSIPNCGIFALLCYSLRNASTGFAMAAFIAWKLIVINAMSNAPTAAIINANQLIVILYAKS